MDLFQPFLILHILAGATGLLIGSLVLIRKKGDATHKFIGKIFAIAMIATGVFSFVLAILHPSLFLFIVGVFTIYLSVTGYRMIHLKSIHNGQKPLLIDYLTSSLMVVASLIFLFIGIKNLLDSTIFGIVYMLFGLLSLRMCFADFKAFSGLVTDKMYWLKTHIGRMTGVYIASLTAFLVVNNHNYLPNVLVWSLPGIIGGFFIARTIKNLNNKPLKIKDHG